MKLINYLLVGLMVILVIFGIEALDMQGQKHYQIESNYIDRIINNASNDAVNVLKHSVESNYSIRASKNDASIAVDAFMTSMSNALGSDISITKQMLMNYMPFAAVVDDEGYSFLAAVSDDKNKSTYQKQMTPKIKFYHQLGDHIIYLNNDPLITVISITGGKYEAERFTREDWLNNTTDSQLLNFFSDSNYVSNVHKIKRDQLVSDINYYVNAHNAYAEERGIFYNFIFEDKLLSIDFDNITFIVGFQGMPITAQKRFDKFAHNGFKILHQTPYIGFMENGVLYFMSEDKNNGVVDNADILKRFESDYDAVLAGYFPYSKSH